MSPEKLQVKMGPDLHGKEKVYGSIP